MALLRLRQFAHMGLAMLGLCLSLHPSYADAGLIVETPTGFLGFLSNVGHVSVWISHGCLTKAGEVKFCENSQGIVLTSTAYWSNPGAAAIPAELFFLGSRPGVAGRSQGAWSETLGMAYPAVNPKVGRKYFGRAWLRGMRVLTFHTSAEEDRRVLALVEEQRRSYSYSYSRRNCAYYAEQVMKLYLGNDFHGNRLLDFGIDTPRALERALQHRLEMEPTSSFRTIQFKGARRHSWRQPPRNICESAIFDPKYAVPLVMYEPYLYVGFAACYGVTRFQEMVWTHARPGELSSAQIDGTQEKRPDSEISSRLATFVDLTGALPLKSRWISVPMKQSGVLNAAGTPAQGVGAPATELMVTVDPQP